MRPGRTTLYVHTGMTLKGKNVAARGEVGIVILFFLKTLKWSSIQVDVVKPSWLQGGDPELPPAPHNTEAPTQVMDNGHFPFELEF